MLQVEIVTGMTTEELQGSINAFLKTLPDDEAVRDIKIDTPEGTATILYIVKEKWKGQLCCDCKFWDDSGDHEAVIGLCQVCGGRRRFSSNSCEKFQDVRG